MNAPLDRAHLASPSPASAPAQDITLDDKWTLERGRAFMTGTQALIRLPMLQRERDVKAGLNTAGYITGYRGSPVTSVDQTAMKAKAHLDAHHVKFHPGMNEDLAATAVWGTQQTNLYKDAKYDGVFSMWYGKGPCVDAAATCSSTATTPARRNMAACWCWPATTTRPNRRPPRTSPTTS